MKALIAATVCLFFAGCHGQSAPVLPPLQWCGAGGQCYRYSEDAGMWFEDCPIKGHRGRLVDQPAHNDPGFLVTGPAISDQDFLVTGTPHSDPGFLVTGPFTKGTSDDSHR